jgi:hypothetical protein
MESNLLRAASVNNAFGHSMPATTGAAQAAAAQDNEIRCKVSWPPSLLPVATLAFFAGLGLVLAWLLDSSSQILGQTPDRLTQFLLVLMCLVPASALFAFRWLSKGNRSNPRLEGRAPEGRAPASPQ